MTEVKPRIRLDWSRLLGFDQADASEREINTGKLRAQRLAKLGTKLGTKPGVKFGVKTGVKVGVSRGVRL